MLHRNTIAVAAVLAGALAPLCSAQDLRDSWHALPDETVLVLRVPEPAQAVEHLRETTKFGKVLLAPDRWSKLMQWLKDDPDTDWEQFESELARLGLKPEDLTSSWNKPFGLGLVLQPREDADQPPIVILLAWQEAGDELAEKYLTAIERSVEQQEDQENPVRRVDLELAGRNVIHLKVPELEIDWEGGAWEDEPMDMVPEEGFAHPAPRQAGEPPMGGMADEDADYELTTTHVDQTNVYVTRIGGRVVAAVTIPNNSGSYWVQKVADPDAAVDFDALSGANQAAGVFARFLEAHEDEDHDYAQRMLSTPGMQAVMPEGLPMVELFGDLRPVWAMLERIEDEDGPMKYVRMLGADSLTTLGMRLAADGNVLRSGLFVAAPSPRRGLVALLDQPELEPSPAPWAPTHAVEYGHLSFDLGAAYKTIRDLAEREFGDQARMGFQQVDASVQALAQADLATVLSALGRRHMVVTFGPKQLDDLAHARPAELNRMAIVWQLQDEQIWQRMIMAIAALQATPVGEQLEMVEGQGFTGWRLTNPQVEMATMIGKGYLTLTIGSDVTSQVLNVLRSEPEGEAALAHSERLTRFNEVFEAKPGLAYRIVDGDRMLQGLVAMFAAGFSEGMAEEADPEAAELQRRLVELMPTREQMVGVLGVSGSHVYMTDDGLVSEGFAVMPE